MHYVSLANLADVVHRLHIAQRYDVDPAAFDGIDFAVFHSVELRVGMSRHEGVLVLLAHHDDVGVHFEEIFAAEFNIIVVYII